MDLSIQDWCSYCGLQRRNNEREMERDHIVPRSKGGSNHSSNFLVCCWQCNRIKSAKSLDEARPLLNQRRYGWPRFNLEQIKWLKQNNFDVSLLEGSLPFEEK